MGYMRWIGQVVAVGMVAVSAACAGATVGSGVGDAVLTRPPFTAGRLPAADVVIGHTPVVYQPGAVNVASFDPKETAVAELVANMNAYLAGMLGRRPLTAEIAERGDRPDVQFSCVTDAIDECDEDGAVRDGRREMRLAVTRATTQWTYWLAEALSSERATHAILLTVEIGEYWPRQKNLLGAKEIELGPDHVVSLPWLTGLDRPVSVIQLTGALVDSTGRAVRIGAEGLLARRTNLLIGSIDAQVLITDEDVAALRTAVRDDLPGRPLVWQAALHDLIEGLTGRDAGSMADGGAPAPAARNPFGRQQKSEPLNERRHDNVEGFEYRSGDEHPGLRGLQ
jgi:hypothetical protein